MGGGEVEGKFSRERTYVYLWLIHADIWQKPTQYCKAIILQLKMKKKNEVYKTNAREGVEKRELSYIAGGNRSWCSHSGKQYGSSSEN